VAFWDKVIKWKEKLNEVKKELIYQAYLAGEPLEIVSKVYRVSLDEVERVIKEKQSEEAKIERSKSKEVQDREASVKTTCRKTFT